MENKPNVQPSEKAIRLMTDYEYLASRVPAVHQGIVLELLRLLVEDSKASGVPFW